MHFNHFDSKILGAINPGQASTIVVEGTHRATLRVLLAKFARPLALRLGLWRALRCMPGTMTPAMVTCPSYTDRRQQRDQRCVSGVVVDDRTVGVC